MASGSFPARAARECLTARGRRDTCEVGLRLRVRDPILGNLPVSRLRGGRIVPAVAFLIASCGRPPQAGKALDPTPAAVAAPAAASAAPADASGYRTAFDFIANRVHAVSHRDGRLVVDVGALD